ncbi:hypothetical protein OLS38_07565 [Campylobacter jejuni]|nr:hypothetical protein [Campylobacter jejuni]
MSKTPNLAKNALERNQNKNIFICLHHAPFKTGLRAMDFIGLDEKHSLELYKLFNSYKNIKHLFFGHYHSTLCGRWKDISFSSLKGINHQVKFDLNSNEILLEIRNPEYAVVLLNNEVLNIHYNDFTFDKNLIFHENKLSKQEIFPAWITLNYKPTALKVWYLLI